uniref:Uncharacterized protein n=1 Tax=Amphimedon queenslandica TaxID=400682 RepID=A0A1X7UC30_AMPQE
MAEGQGIVLRNPHVPQPGVALEEDVNQDYRVTSGQGAEENLFNRDTHADNPVFNEESNDTISQSQPETSLPQMQAQSRPSTTTDLSEDERNYTINANHDPVLDDQINEPIQQPMISLPETQDQTCQSTTTDLSDSEWNYTTGIGIQPKTTNYETDYAYSSHHSPKINYIRKHNSIAYFDSSGHQTAIETVSQSDINPNSASISLSNHNCIAFDIYSVQETGKEQFPEERVTVKNNLSENITITYSKSL